MVQWEQCRIKVQARPAGQQVWGERPVRVAGTAPGMGRVEAVGLLHHYGVDGPPLRVLVLDDTIARLRHDGWEEVSHLHMQEPTPAHCMYFTRHYEECPVLDTYNEATATHMAGEHTRVARRHWRNRCRIGAGQCD